MYFNDDRYIAQIKENQTAISDNSLISRREIVFPKGAVMIRAIKNGCLLKLRLMLQCKLPHENSLQYSWCALGLVFSMAACLKCPSG